MGKRTKQSNRPEVCPVCGKYMNNRAAASSHYKGHVRRGDLIERDGRYCAPDYPYGKEFVWWDKRGISLDYRPGETLGELRTRWYSHWRKIWWMNVASNRVQRVIFEYVPELDFELR